MSNERKLESASVVVERALGVSRTDECIVIIDDGDECEVRFANNTVTTNGQRRNRSVSVIAFAERKNACSVGVASKSGPVDIEALVRSAEQKCNDAPNAEDATALIGPHLSDLSFDQGTATTDLSVLSGIISALPDVFARAVSEDVVLAGFARHSMETTYLASSTGLRRRFVQPDGTIELVGRDATRSAWVSAGTNDFRDVSLEALSARLATRLSWSERQLELPAGRYETILPPDAVADLMVPLVEAMSGRDAEDGQNVFAGPSGSTRIGERLANLGFDLFSAPDLTGLESAPFIVSESSGTDVSVFDNGCPIERTEWIADGRLARLAYHRAGASRSKGSFTAPASNLALELAGANDTLEELIANTNNALLLTCLWYIREVDPTTLLLTGLTRDGVYQVRDGEVIGAVNNFRFNESPIDVLGRSLEAGRRERALSREWNEWMSRTSMCPLRVADFNMSTVSPAS